MTSTSASLLARLADAHDGAAWNRFVELYAPSLHAWASRCGIVGAETDDVVQETLAIVWKKMPSFQYDPAGSFRAWLRRVAENKAREFLRRRRPNARIRDAALPDVSAVDAASEFWEREHREILASRALRIMQREFRETTWRACWEMTFADRPAADVAAELGISENACYVAKSRVLRRLRETLEGFV